MKTVGRAVHATPNVARRSPRLLVKRLSFVAALFLVIPETSPAQVVRADTARRVPINRNGSWSAQTSGGQPLIGGWTAVLDTAGTVTGTWTLIDAQGNTLAEGAWSAAKSPDSWTGAWRAIVSGRNGELLGTWTATMGGNSDAPLADLFSKGPQAIVSGGWRLGERSGPWSIRTFK
jgi:hypothetical protein